MKVGPRTPNLKKRVTSRTTGRAKRAVKSSVNPFYGKKGAGWVNDPKKAAYNKAYKKTTFDSLDSNNSGAGLAIGCAVVAFTALFLLLYWLFSVFS
ncbi:hypothetical protein [Streptococcus hyovaginalis]|uniref:hypothetical protein n=1 Tax=Streptococcus hyovaginalis TaxID=149015 RepID=UPI002A812C70|nr:hypothetical protein [Streptococcus hyovaginalis]MDY4511742.1 hypothetical protein [Streptococcus hyovaginalis]